MSDKTVKTAIVGLGRWGKNVARELSQVSDLRAYVTTGSEERTAWATTHLPTAVAMTLEEVYADPTIEAVAIATPIATHADIALTLIRAGKHVFVEKPLARSAEAARGVEEAARAQNVTLMTGYIFLYAPTYRVLKERIKHVPVKEVTMRWHKYGTFTEDIESNLQTHHLALALDLFGEPMHGTKRRGPGIESACDSIETHLTYGTHAVTSIIDRASPEHLHVIEVSFTDGTSLCWEGANVFDGNQTVIYSNEQQPLQEEMKAFIAAIGGTDEPTTGDFGTRVLLLAEQLKTL